MAKIGDKVWVLLYNHKHGTDFSVHKSEEGAIRMAAAIVEDFLGEREEEDQEKIRRLLKKKDWRAVIAAYVDTFENSYEPEWFNWEERAIEA